MSYKKRAVLAAERVSLLSNHSVSSLLNSDRCRIHRDFVVHHNPD